MRLSIIKNWINNWKKGFKELGNQLNSFKDNKKLYLEMGKELRKQYEINRKIKKDLKQRRK